MSNDLTQNLPGDATTKPTLEAILARINTFGETLTSQIKELDDRLTQQINNLAREINNINVAIAQLRSESESGFRRVERKIELLNNDFLGMRADQGDLLSRIEALEKQAS